MSVSPSGRFDGPEPGSLWGLRKKLATTRLSKREGAGGEAAYTGGEEEDTGGEAADTEGEEKDTGGKEEDTGGEEEDTRGEEEVLVRPPETHMRLGDALSLLERPTAESFYVEYNAVHQYLGARCSIHTNPFTPSCIHTNPFTYPKSRFIPPYSHQTMATNNYVVYNAVQQYLRARYCIHINAFTDGVYTKGTRAHTHRELIRELLLPSRASHRPIHTKQRQRVFLR